MASPPPGRRCADAVQNRDRHVQADGAALGVIDGADLEAICGAICDALDCCGSRPQTARDADWVQ